MSFELEASGFELEISVANIDDLKLHEEIIDSLLEDLADSIKEDGEIKDPVIVDRDTEAVLDGMHRVSAIEKLGYNKIPVCFVNYQDSRVKVGSWNRIFGNLQMKRLLRLCEGQGFEIDECDPGKISEILSERRSELIFVSEDESYSLSRDFKSVKEVYDSASEIEETLKAEGSEPRYETERDIVEKLRAGEIALLIPPAKKKEVIDIALSSSVFPYKTTRHVIPTRPMRINLPLDLLGRDLLEVDEELTNRLKDREVEHLSPGSRFEGREYEEELLIFK